MAHFACGGQLDFVPREVIVTWHALDLERTDKCSLWSVYGLERSITAQDGILAPQVSSRRH